MKHGGLNVLRKEMLDRDLPGLTKITEATKITYVKKSPGPVNRGEPVSRRLL